MLCLRTGFFKLLQSLKTLMIWTISCELIYLTHFKDSEKSKLSQDFVRQLSNMNL